MRSSRRCDRPSQVGVRQLQDDIHRARVRTRAEHRILVITVITIFWPVIERRVVGAGLRLGRDLDGIIQAGEAEVPGHGRFSCWSGLMGAKGLEQAKGIPMVGINQSKAFAGPR